MLPTLSPTYVRELRIAPSGIVGDLVIPEGASGIVIFAHGSGSGRHSSRNRYVASVLQERRMGTLLLDLLTASEEQADQRNSQFRFDIGLLASRLRDAVYCLRQDSMLREYPLAFFGASTGAGAALQAAADLQEVVTVVSRGGRPDLAGSALDRVQVPVLMLVGEMDTQVLRLNQEAAERIKSSVHLKVIPNAGHLFEERGTLEEAARIASVWLERFLRTAPR
jgi:putative phosphoribosyl transferase